DPATSGARGFAFGILRPPPGVAVGSGNMPILLGDEPYTTDHPKARLTVTQTQYELMRRWRNGHFSTAGPVPPPRPAGPVITPHGLDRAALEACIGGGFYPGIEVGWQIRDLKLYLEPFRIDHRA